MSVYRSRNERQKEKLATVFLWLLALGCAFYISWMINPHPIEQGIRWVGDQTEQFFDRCATQALMQTLPSISCFCLSQSSNQIENTDTGVEADTAVITADPFYTKYLSFSQPGDG